MNSIIWLWITCLVLTLVESCPLSGLSRGEKINTRSQSKSHERGEERMMRGGVLKGKSIIGAHEQLSWIEPDKGVHGLLKSLVIQNSQLNIFMDPRLIIVADYVQLYNERTKNNLTLLELLLTMLTAETLLQKLSKILQLSAPLEHEKKLANVVMNEMLKSWYSQKLSADDVFLKLKLDSSIDAIMFQRGYRQLLETYLSNYLPESETTTVLELLIKHFGNGVVAESLACWKFAKSHYVAFFFRAPLYTTDFTRSEAEMASVYAETLLHYQLQNWMSSKISISWVIKLLDNSNEHSVLSTYNFEVLRTYINMRGMNIESAMVNGMMNVFGSGRKLAIEIEKALHESRANASTLKAIQNRVFMFWIKQGNTPSKKFIKTLDNMEHGTIVNEFKMFYNSRKEQERNEKY